MSPQQKRSFLPYTRGINPEDLRLGSLYLNPLDPDDGLESKRFEYQEDLEQDEYEEHVKQWTRREQKDERGFSLEFELAKDSSFALKFSDWVKVEADANSSLKATLEGKSGRRLKIKKPETFLRDEVIKQEGVQEWIRTHASISYKGLFGHHKWKAPEIWMVTGVQLVTGGDVQAGTKASTHGGAGAGGDAGLAFGAPPGVAAVSAEASHGHSEEATNGYGYDDERVWAAQFMEVTIEYGDDEDHTLTAQDGKLIPKTIARFKLEDIADLRARGIRASRDIRVQANGKSTPKPPKPIGRVTVAETTEEDELDDIHVDDMPYIHALAGTEWDIYNECSQYLADAQSRQRSISPSPLGA